MYKQLLQSILSNFTKILFYAAVLFGAFFLYKNYQSVLNWFRFQTQKINSDETPTPQDLINPKFVIDQKIISNYVDVLYSSMSDMGTDEIAMHRVYKNLLNTDKANTIAVWNEWNKRSYKYRRQDGVINPLFGGGELLNLYQVMQSELTNNDSEKAALINWSTIFRRAGLI